MLPKYEARMSADGQSLDLMLYGPMGEDWYGDGSRIDCMAVAKLLAANKSAKTINMRVASLGGDPFHAMAIYSVLRDHPAKKIGVIEGLCASAMSLVVCVCDELSMSETGLFMIHEARWGTYGTVAEQQATLDATAKVNEISAGIYAARTGLSLADVKAMMAAETWMTASEAKAKKFVDSTKALKVMSASAGHNDFSKVPEHMKGMLAQLLKESSMSEGPAVPATPAVPPAAAVVPAVTPVAVANPAVPVAPAVPAAAVPAVPVAQPVVVPDMAAERVRASQIVSACQLAGRPEMAADFITRGVDFSAVQGALLQAVCAGGKPVGDATPGNGTGNKPANENSAYEAEFEAQSAVYASMGITKEQYITSRRRDAGRDVISMVPTKKAGS